MTAISLCTPASPSFVSPAPLERSFIKLSTASARFCRSLIRGSTSALSIAMVLGAITVTSCHDRGLQAFHARMCADSEKIAPETCQAKASAPLVIQFLRLESGRDRPREIRQCQYDHWSPTSVFGEVPLSR